MEGPSLFLAQEQLSPFKGKTILEVSGNSKIGIDRLKDQKVEDLFAWGKHLVFQFEDFAIRIHFLLFGTFEAEVNGVWVTGDYHRTKEPRLSLTFKNGVFKVYNGSIKVIEDKNIRQSYDFSIDIMSDNWNPQKAFNQLKSFPEEQIADVLLDQTVFSGVGNMIKNEVLSIVKVNPKTLVKDISDETLKNLIQVTKDFSWQFYLWRKEFQLRNNLKVHRKSVCPHCGEKLVREKTGKRQRWSYYCPHCQS